MPERLQKLEEHLAVLSVDLPFIESPCVLIRSANRDGMENFDARLERIVANSQGWFREVASRLAACDQLLRQADLIPNKASVVRAHATAFMCAVEEQLEFLRSECRVPYGGGKLRCDPLMALGMTRATKLKVDRLFLHYRKLCIATDDILNVVKRDHDIPARS